MLNQIAAQPLPTIQLVVCDLSASPHMDLSGVQMLRKLHATLAADGIRLAVTGPHGQVRDLLRRDAFADLVGGVERDVTLDAILAGITPELARSTALPSPDRPRAQ